jgi:uncharacterized protein
VRALRLAAFVLVALAATRAAFAKDVPPPPAQWFTDEAGLVSSTDAAALNEKLRAFEQSSGAQFIIYIFKSLDGHPLEDFTIRCATKWKVGNKKYDNGLILFVFAQERKIRIEVGYGLEGTVTDAIASRVERQVMTPRFRSGDYAGGLNAAADYLITTITKGEPAHEPVNAQSRSSSSGHMTGDPVAFPLSCGVLLLIFAALIILPRLFLPRRGSGFGGCFWPLFLLGGGGRGTTFGSGWSGGGGWGGGGGFSGGGGGFGGGGASGGW